MGWRIWRRFFRLRLASGGLFVILENARNLAEKALLLLSGLLILSLLAIRGRLDLLITKAEDPRQNAFYPAILITGAGRLGTDNEC